MLLMYAMTVPLVVVGFVDSIWLGCLVNFFCVQSYWCLNEVARDLEDPFVYDPNDLPLARYQVRRIQQGPETTFIETCESMSSSLLQLDVVVMLAA